MQQQTLIISPKSNEKFLVAKVCVPISEIKKTQIKIIPGYDLYWSCEKSSIEKFDFPDGNLLGGQILSAQLLTLIKKNFKSAKLVNLYWIKSGELLISVGWGCRNRNYGINGRMQLRIINFELFIQNYQSISWESYIQNGISFEYLSEFYLGDDQKPRGLDWELGERFLPIITSAINGLTEITDSTVTGVVKNAMENEKLIDLSLEYIGTTCKLIQVTNDFDNLHRLHKDTLD